MSRIDTQDDRLVRGTEPFQPRTVATPARITPERKSALRELITSVGNTAGVVGQAVETQKRKSDKIEAEGHLASFNRLLESERAATEDPTKIEKYAEDHRDFLEVIPDTSPLRSRALKLPTVTDLGNHAEAQRKNVENQFKGVIRDTIIELRTTTFLPDDIKYITNREDSVALVRESIVESLDDTTLKAVNESPELAKELDRQAFATVENLYGEQIDAIASNRREAGHRNARSGVASLLRSGVDVLTESANNLSLVTGQNVEAEQVFILSEAADQILVDQSSNAITVEEALVESQNISDIAQTSGSKEATKVALELQDKIIRDYTLSSNREMRRSVDDMLASGKRSYADITSDANAIMIKQWEDATGLVADTNDITTLTAGSGPSAELANSLSLAYTQQEGEIAALAAETARSSKVTAKSGYERRLDAQAINAVRRGDGNAVTQFFTDHGIDHTSIPDPVKLFEAGIVDATSMFVPFSNRDRLSAPAQDAWVNGDTEERKWALGNILSYGEGSFTQTLKGMPDDQRYGMLALREAAATAGMYDIFLRDDPEEIAGAISDLQAAYDSGTRTAQVLSGEVGSSPISKVDVEGVSVLLRDSLEVHKEANLSSSVLNIIRSTLSQVDLVFTEDMSDKEKFNRVNSAIKASGKTIYFDGLSNAIEVIDDPQKAHPISRGVPSETLENDLQTVPGFELLLNKDTSPVDQALSFAGTATGLSGGTPLITSVIATDLGVNLTDPNNLVELAGALTSQELQQTEEAFSSPEFEKLFEAEEDEGNFLRLSIGMVGDQPYLIATGVINDTLRGGDDAIVLTEWDPAWSSAMGNTTEQVALNSAVGVAAANTSMYLADPNTLGGQGTRVFLKAYKGVREGISGKQLTPFLGIPELE